MKIKSNKLKLITPQVLIQVLLIAWALTQIFPIIWMLYSSFKTTPEIMQNIWALPKSFYLGNYIDAWSGKGNTVSIGVYFKNSIIVTGISLILLAFIPTTAAYAIAKFKFPGRTFLLILMIGLISIPVHSVIIPIYYFLDKLRLINNYFGLIFAYVAFNIPFSVLLLQSFFREFPDEIIEAARVDGCGEIGVFFRIVFPITRGAIATVLIVAFINIWNEFLFATIVMKDNLLKTIPVGLTIFTSTYNVKYGILIAALCSASIPAIIFYFIFHRTLVAGMTVGAIKE